MYRTTVGTLPDSLATLKMSKIRISSILTKNARRSMPKMTAKIQLVAFEALKNRSGSYANVTVADLYTKTPRYTFVNKLVVNFKQRNSLGGEGAGGWFSRRERLRCTGVNDMAMFSCTKSCPK